MKPTESHSSVGKDGLHHSVTEKATHVLFHLVHNPQAPVADKVAAPARRVFLKFDLILVLPMLIMFCESDVGYIHQLTLLYVSKIYSHSLTGSILAMLESLDFKPTSRCPTTNTPSL